MDVLSEVLANCRSERAATARFSLAGPWALQSAGVEGALIRMSIGGAYWITMEGEAPLMVGPRDLVLLPHGSPHVVSAAPGLVPVPFSELISRHGVGEHGDNPLVFSFGSGAGVVDLFSAHLWFSAYCRNSVIKILPKLVHVRENDRPATATLAAMMESLVDETLAQRPGWKLSAARMADLLLVHILRDHLARDAAKEANWIRGLTDTHIAHAIMLMHQDPRAAWTVGSLAQAVNMSRSSFSARFRELVDMSPIRYLTEHRMALAADRLESGMARVAEVAEHVGYGSDKVFARAFQRWAGVTPGAYARRERAHGDGVALTRGDASR